MATIRTDGRTTPTGWQHFGTAAALENPGKVFFSKYTDDTGMPLYETTDETRMDPIIKQYWVDTLRSGKFQQGQGLLKQQPRMQDEPQYCCLGVLCEINGIASRPRDMEGNLIQQEWSFLGRKEPEPESLSSTYYMYAASLPGFLMEELNIRTNDGKINAQSYTETGAQNPYRFVPLWLSLAELNDLGFTFNQLADLIDYFF